MSLVMEQYGERLRRKRRSPHTLSAFATVSTRYARWLEARGVTDDQVNYVLLEDYFDQLGTNMAPNTVAQHMKLVKAAYNYAIARGTLRHNPAIDLDLPAAPDREPVTIPANCLRIIRSRALTEREWVFFHLLVYTGMRRAEMRGLVFDDGSEDRSVIRLEDQTIRVFGKGQKMRLVPIHPALGEVLAEQDQTPGRFVLHSDGVRGVAEETIQKMVKQLSPVFTPHDYRRTVATSLARNNVPERVIDRIMGWSKREVRDRYYVAVAPAELHRGILRLYADDPL